MADSEIPDLTPVSTPLDGTEMVHVVQGGNSRVGLISDIADLIPPGDDGANGKTILNGVVAPTTEGVDGDFYVDTVTHMFYGPKASGTWPSGFSIIGDDGAAGQGFVDRGPWDTATADYVPFDFVTFGSPTRVYMNILAADASIDDPATATTYWAKMGAPGVDGVDGATPTIIETSTSSVALGNSGTKTFAYTSDPNLAWVIGQRLRAINDTTHYMEGVITAVSATSVSFTADLSVGAGTFSSWTLALAGNPGINGTDGSDGTSYPAFSINAQTGTTYTMQDSDFAGNVMVTFDNVSPITVTVPSGITNIEPCVVCQLGDGQVTFVGSGASFIYANGLKLYGQNSFGMLTPMATNIFGFCGDTTP
mgnify:CR=1 FL=1